MSFFAKELQKFNAKSSGPISGAHLQGADDQLPRTKRRRLENHDEAYPSRGSNMLVLPEEEILQVVFQAYFSRVHPWIPILHEASFRRRLAEPHNFDALRVVLHAMVLAASRYIADEDTATTAFSTPQQRVMARDWVVSQAMKHLTVESLQALIIVAFNDVRFLCSLLFTVTD